MAKKLQSLFTVEVTTTSLKSRSNS